MRRRFERARAAVFAGDARVWRAALLAGVPLLLVLVLYLAVPRAYYTGTDNVETYSYVAQVEAGVPVCVPGLRIPAGTGRLRLQLLSHSHTRPALALTMQLWQRPLVHSSLPPVHVSAAGRDSFAVFDVPRVEGASTSHSATICMTAAGQVNWGGTPSLTVPTESPPTEAGTPIAGRVAVWYLPPPGEQRSYLSRAGAILRRASLFRAGFVGPWLFVVILLLVLPGLALASVRCLALAAAHRSGRFGNRRMALGLFVIAAVNFACWSLLTPPFQAPDEVDHFAYTQTLVEKSESPTPDPGSHLQRWSSSEALLLEDMSFNNDHQVGGTRLAWEPRQERIWKQAVTKLHPKSDDGGGVETAATHGPIYYAALAPAYMLASSSPLAQLTLMRLFSALLGALAVLFAFLLARDLAPGRPWLAVLSALLIAYQPMYGFISGSVNNDVGVNAGGAALMLLLILVMRRGWRPWLALALGATLLVLPAIKQTAFSLYPVAGLAIAVALWRHRRVKDIPGYAAAAGAAALAWWLAKKLQSIFHPTGVAAAAVAGTASSAVSEAIAHPLGYLGYLWEVFLPRLPFMAPHFRTSVPAGYEIFVERGFGAFGWYDVLFPHWVFLAVFLTMVAVALLALPAASRERSFLRANAAEAAVILLAPVAVVAGVEAAFYTIGTHPLLAEFGRYAFPAIVPLALIVVGCLHGLGRRLVLPAGVVLLVAMIALSFAGQLLTLTGFYA